MLKLRTWASRVMVLGVAVAAVLLAVPTTLALAQPAHDVALDRTLAVQATGADIPGTPQTLPFKVDSAFSGTDALYGVHLDAGERLVAWLYGTSSTPAYSLFLYEPGAASVEDTSAVVAHSPFLNGWDPAGFYPNVVSYVATATGTYYLDAFDWGRGGAYTLLAWVKPADPDNEPSGAATESLPFTANDSLSASADTDDVFSVHLSKGQILRTDLVGASGTRFAISLFVGSPLGTVDDPTCAIVASSRPGTSAQSIKWAASRTGDYCIDVAQHPAGLGYSGVDGTYTVTAAVVPKTVTSLDVRLSPSRVKLGKAVALKGALAGGGLDDHCAVEVRLPGSSTWKSLASVTCKWGNTWSFGYKPHKKGTYGLRVRFAGDEYRTACVSKPVVLHVK